jgi:hypothetical protein
VPNASINKNRKTIGVLERKENRAYNMANNKAQHGSARQNIEKDNANVRIKKDSMS